MVTRDTAEINAKMEEAIEEVSLGYPDFPVNMNALGQFVYLRTYSRFLPSEGRRETWLETVKRVTRFNVGLSVLHMMKNGIAFDFEDIRKEMAFMFHSVFHLNQFPSGRSLWVGGAEGGVAEKYPLANFNCSFTNITKWEDLGEVFYLLMVGAGVGLKVTKKFAEGLPALRNDLEVNHIEYTQRYPLTQEPNTSLHIVDGGKRAVIHIGDSKEGWRDALDTYLALHYKKEYGFVEEVSVYYDYIRPKGTRLKTFGGTASGYEPMKEMLEGITKVIRGGIDKYTAAPEVLEGNESYSVLRPVHVMDIANLVGYNVVAGGVRRTAEIFLFDEDDYESMMAKYGMNGIWDDYDSKGIITKTAEEKHEEVMQAFRNANLPEIADLYADLPLRDENARRVDHRRMSNNSVAFTRKPKRSKLKLMFALMRNEGEPGFINLRELAIRRLQARGIFKPSEALIEKTIEEIGVNPCAEIALQSKGVCNLTTINVMAFVFDNLGTKMLDVDGLVRAQELSTRIGLRMTLPEMELEEWNKTQQTDRLIGTSLTGWQSAIASVGLSKRMQDVVLRRLHRASREEASRYAKELRVNEPLLTTTIKPEGTLSQVAGGVSEGLHFAHSPYYIRRVRISATDPMATAMLAQGYSLKAEIGTKDPVGNPFPVDKLDSPEALMMARTYVTEFPVASGANKTKDDVHVDEQFDVYFQFQKNYTEHNSSITIHLRPDEWGRAEERIWDGWDDFVGVSFLPYDGGTYALAPYETISEQEYNYMSATFPTFSMEVLREYDSNAESDLEGIDECVGGACPVR